MPHLTRQHVSPRLDVAGFVGQRSSSFRFDVVDAVTGYRREIRPVMASGAGIRHDTRSTIKRTISGLQLGQEDTATFNSLTARLEPFMLVAGEEFSLGRYIPSDWARFTQTSGATSSVSFYDEAFIIDQQISNAFGANSADGELVQSMLLRFLQDYPVTFHVEPSSFASLGSWGAGTRGGFIMDQLALDGDYLSPWFDNTSTLRFRRVFDPARELPTFDFDDEFHVVRDTIVESDNLIDAPNRFIVVGNGAESLGQPIVGMADIPSSAPHSIANRGFVVPEVITRQVQSDAQAGAIAINLAQNQTLVEQVELSTLPDPRHDAYDVVLWREVHWLELAWTLPFNSDGVMTHVMRRAYE